MARPAWWPTLSLRHILAALGLLGVAYVGGMVVVIILRFAPLAGQLQEQSYQVMVAHDAIESRIECLEQLIADATHLVTADRPNPAPGTTPRIAALRLRLDSISVTRASAVPLGGVPPEVRRTLALATATEAEVDQAIRAALGQLARGRADSATATVRQANRIRERSEALLEAVQRRALLGMIERERDLSGASSFASRALVWWLAGGLAIVIGASLVLRRRIDVPLDELQKALARIAAGDLGASITPRRDDELGRLGRHFNEMTEVLRLRAEDERRRRENLAERLGHLLEDSDNEILVVESESLAVRQASRGLLEHLGWSISELLEMRAPELVPPVDAPALYKLIRELRTRGFGHGRLETRLRRRDGRTYPVTLDLQHSAAEHPPVFVVVAHDISERREAERLRDTLRAFTLSRGPALAKNDVDTVLRELTTAVVDTLAASRASLWRFDGKALRGVGATDRGRAPHALGTSLAAGACPRYVESLRRDRVVAVEDTRAHAPTLELVHAGVALRGIASSLDAPVRVAGQLVGVLRIEQTGASREWTTDEANFAASMADYAAVAFETAERRHLQVQLAEAQRIESVGMLAGGVAHDFNNLLTAVMSHVDLATLQLPPDHPATDDLRGIQHAATRAAELTRQLLTFARRQIVSPKVLALNHLTKQMDKMLRRVIGENVELVTLLDPHLKLTCLDPTQYEQVLVNLAVNARDAMPDGGTLTIATANVELSETEAAAHPDLVPGDYVMVSVSDTGCGMDEAVRQRIFEPFFTTKERGRGTGLGLATVYGIVRQSHGHITVDSVVGAGTTFRVYFPVEAGTAETADTEEHPAVPGGNETILLVEDERQIRDVLTRALSGQGYRLLVASNGAEGLEVARRHQGPIDLLVTDIVMPLMGGRELSDSLGAARPGLATLFISGYPEQQMGKNGVIDEGVDFLPKPFTAAELARRVRQTLDAAKASRGVLAGAAAD